MKSETVLSNGIAEELLGHVSDSDVFELFPGVEVPLPGFMTVDAVMILLGSALITIFVLSASRRLKFRVKGPAAWLEFLVVFVRDDIVYPVMGEERGREWLPFFTAMFLFLAVVNLLGLVPAFKTATGNMTVTTSLALVVLVLMFVIGFKQLGAPGFFRNLFPSGAPLPVAGFVFLLEFSGLFVKSVILSLRLFANMFAGHLAILSFLVLILVMHPLMMMVSVPLALFTYLLEILVALIQALVFTLLSCIFISLASTGHEHSEQT